MQEAEAPKKSRPQKKQPSQEQLNRLTKGRAQLIMQFPFFGTLALRMHLKEDNSVRTGYVDGRNIGYSAQFVAGLRPPQVMGFLAHEVLHMAFLHHVRRGHRNVQRWNVAADYAINLVLDEAGLELPDKALIDKQYAGMTAEQIYEKLPEGSGGGSGAGGWDDSDQDPGGCGGVVDSEGTRSGNTSVVSAEIADMKVTVAQAAHAARMAGKLPAGLERFVEELLKTRTPWRDILRRFMTQRDNDDFSWMRGNRRLLARGLYLPSAWSEAMGAIVVCIDTSGSIGQAELNLFLS